jgi:hypothetical protein
MLGLFHNVVFIDYFIISTSMPVSNNAALDTLLQKLPTLINRDMIDQAATEFCYLNSKGARKKLIKVSNQSCSLSPPHHHV